MERLEQRFDVGRETHAAVEYADAQPVLFDPGRQREGRRRNKPDLALDLHRRARAVVRKEGIAVRGEDERHVDHLRVFESLLHAVAEV